MLGVATDTGDAEGLPVASADVNPFDDATLERVIASLRGARTQVPPMYSALKRNGRPLYELARRGVEVEREARPITIESLVVTSRSTTGATPAIDIEVVCSKGTYIRVLAEEIAAGLGTRGHLGALRRLWVDPFAGSAMVTLEEIESTAADPRPAWLAPVDAAFPDLPRLVLDEIETLHLCQGRTLARPDGLPEAAQFRAYGADGTFLGLVEPGPGDRLQVLRLFVPGAGTGGPVKKVE
jgi:tRNA pseudouridine55 synthase